MYYVYLIKSLVDSNRVYVGYTTNLEQRLRTHNLGGAIHTSHYRPWQLVMYLGFENETKAREFEKYLKTASGKSFASKRLMKLRHI